MASASPSPVANAAHLHSPEIESEARARTAAGAPPDLLLNAFGHSLEALARVWRVQDLLWMRILILPASRWQI